MPGKSTITLDDSQLAAIEQRYQITLSEHERKLLTTVRDLLTPLERQEQYLLMQDVSPIRCPGCLSTICRRSAAPHAKDGFDYNKHTPDDSYECPRCGVRLRYYLLLFGGGQGFDIMPEEARAVIH